MIEKKMSNKVTITLNKKNIKAAATMVDMMMASGSLYEEHPIFVLTNEIVKECLKLKKKK
jgi:hypothetical protein